VASLPVAGTHYPRSARDFCSWFSTDDGCLDYLDGIRWPNGFVCGQCDSEGTGWRLADRRIMWAECGARTSVTGGTIFDRTPRPLTVRFHAVWLFSIQKAGGSAKPLRRALGMNSYQTTWTMLHRLRSSLMGPGRERLVGIVEVDEAYFGGVRPGKPGTAGDGRLLVGVAVEQLPRQATWSPDQRSSPMAARDPPGGGAPEPPAGLPRRIRLPIQSTHVTQPRQGVLPGARVGHRPRAGLGSAIRHEPQAEGDTTETALAEGSDIAVGSAQSITSLAGR
jgi:hypothetical protein